MRIPDPLSLRIADCLQQDDADRILADEECISECARDGIDIHSIVRNLALTVAERISATQVVQDRLNILRLLHELNRRHIRYVTIGGLAGRIYGSSYATNDLDICHARDPENLGAIARMLRDLKAEFRRQPLHVPPKLIGKTLSTETDFVFTTSMGNLDLIGEFTGVGRYADAIEDAIAVDVGPMKVNVLSLPKLMAAKESTGRPKDLLVFRELMIIRKARERLEAAGALGQALLSAVDAPLRQTRMSAPPPLTP